MILLSSLPISDGIQILRTQGFWPFSWRTIKYLHIWDALWNTTTSRSPIGENIFDYEWDLLIILDTCRVDSLGKLSDSRSWLNNINQMRSIGSMSAEWILNTFTEDYREQISETAFVSGNIWSHRIFNERFHEHGNHRYDMIRRGWPSWKPVSSEDFAYYETVSAIANQDDRVHPENEAIPHILTDRTIAVGRKKEFDRLIVHYTLPHLTFIADAIDWEPEQTPITELMDGPDPIRDLKSYELSYDPARRGEVSPETVREAYLQNLRLALDYVNILVENVDAGKAIISADHGEALGEHGLWDHPYGYPFAPVKIVPWVELSASDERTYDPCYDQLKREPTEHERDEFLKQMGYL